MAARILIASRQEFPFQYPLKLPDTRSKFFTIKCVFYFRLGCGFQVTQTTWSFLLMTGQPVDYVVRFPSKLIQGSEFYRREPKTRSKYRLHLASINFANLS